jgi:4-carboxymuconolactone decarboxylase
MKSFTPRLTTARVAPIGRDSRTPAQEKILTNRPDYNIFKTLAHHPKLYERWGSLGQYLLSGSTLPARDREIIILRMGWLCQAPYEWSQHARIAKASANMSDAEVRRVAEGERADGWSDFERTLIRMVDELRYEAMIGGATWAQLLARYSVPQTIDALYTAGQYQLVSMALNSLGVQLDPALDDRIPADLELPQLASKPRAPRLTTPRVSPLTLGEMTEEQRHLTAPQTHDGQLLNLYATMAVHTQLYEPRLRFGRYVQRESGLPTKMRELLILRTACLMHTEYEWAHHARIAQEIGLAQDDIARVKEGPQATQWNEEQRAILQAADELRAEAFIADPTWSTLLRFYDTAAMLEIIFTVGGYAMTGLAINSLGIQVESSYR